MKQFALELPINNLSFGNCSLMILRELYRRGLNPCIFPIGNVDLSSQTGITQEFINWLKQNIETAPDRHNRNIPILKLWHINGSMSSFSKEQNLLTFHETDQLTDTEINILNNQKNILVTSNYTRNTLETFGVNNVKFINLPFDSNNFNKLNKKYYPEDKVVFSVYGKMEFSRKNHSKILQTWAKKYGNNKRYILHAALYNPFIRKQDGSSLTQDEFKAFIIQNVFGGVNYWNINFIPFTPTNAEYNDVLNSSNIVLGLSGGEGRDLPVFQSVALGKHCVALKEHAYLDYLNDENAVLIKSSGKKESHDGLFFHKGAKFNQGYFYDFNPEDMLNGCEEAEKRLLSSRINVKGLELQNLTCEKFVDEILNII